MTTPQKYVFTFFTNDPDPELVMYVRTAATMQEAEAMMRAAGYREFTLYEQRALSAHEIAGVADTRILDRPFLGAEWAPLLMTIELVTARVRANTFWNLTTYGAAYEHDPARSPCVQVMLEDDGSLRLEVSGRNTARSPLTRQQRAKLKSLGWSVPDPIVVNLYDTDPGECGPPTVPDPHQFFAPGWNAHDVARCLLGTLTMVFEITNKDFFNFGEEFQRAESLRLMKRVKDGPVFFLPRRDLPEAEGVATAPEPPGGPFGPQSPQIEALLQRMREMTLDEASGFQGTSDGSVDMARRAGGQLAGGSVRDAAREPSWLAARNAALEVCGGWDGWDQVPVDQDWAPIPLRRAPIPSRCMDSIAFPVMWAAQALALRDVLVTDTLGLELYGRMTRPWAELMGKVHEDDVDVIVSSHGPQWWEIDAVLDRARAMTTEETLLIQSVWAEKRHSDSTWRGYLRQAQAAAYGTGLDAEFEPLDRRVTNALDGARAIEDASVGHPTTRWDAVSYAAAGAASALLVRHLISTDGFSQAAYDHLTRMWRKALGKVHEDDAERRETPSITQASEFEVVVGAETQVPTVGEYGPQTQQITALYERALVLTPDETDRMADSSGAWSYDEWDRALMNAYDAALRSRRSQILPNRAVMALSSAADALLLRDLIGSSRFTQDDYDLCTAAWREAIGPIHPDDGELPEPEAGFGRQTASVEVFLERLANLTASEISRLRVSRQTAHEAAWDSTRNKPRDTPENDALELADEALREAEDWLQEAEDPEERGPVIGAMQDATQGAGDARADLRAVAGPAIRSLRIRHLIDDDGFTRAHYDVLTRPWREAVGKLHPNDADLRNLSTKSIVPDAEEVDEADGDEDNEIDDDVEEYYDAQDVYIALEAAGLVDVEGSPNQEFNPELYARHRQFLCAEGKKNDYSLFSHDDIAGYYLEIDIWDEDDTDACSRLVCDKYYVREEILIALAGPQWSVVLRRGDKDASIPKDVATRLLEAVVGSVLVWQKPIPDAEWFTSKYSLASEILRDLLEGGVAVLVRDPQVAAGVNVTADFLQEGVLSDTFATASIQIDRDVRLTLHILIEEHWADQNVDWIESYVPCDWKQVHVSGDGWIVRIVGDPFGQFEPHLLATAWEAQAALGGDVYKDGIRLE